MDKNDVLNKDIFLFDCDGVILDSNHFKSDAYFEILKKYDVKQAEEFTEFHKNNGGISRFIKFELFFKNYVPKENFKELAKIASDQYAELTVQQLKDSKINDGFLRFIENIQGKKYIVSGGAEVDLLEVFKHKKMIHYFEQILGSPPTKYDIFKSLNINSKKAVYFGDSKLDYEVAKDFDIDFVFMSGLTEFKDWREYFKDKDVLVLHNFEDFEVL